MARRPIFCALLGFCLFAGSSAADFDISKVDRTIRKEPIYLTKSPKYCLLLFGPRAETRVWLVFDGDRLYVDRNHDGDLTSPDKRFQMKEEKSVRVCEVGDLTEADGKTVHRQMQVIRYASNERSRPDRLFIRIKIKGEYYMVTTVEMDNTMDRPAKAPVCHFHGPLCFLVGDGVKFFRTGEAELRIVIGTYYGGGSPHPDRVNLPVQVQPGISLTTLQHDEGIPTDYHPVAEIQFPSAKTGDPPIVRRIPLSQRC